MRWVSRPYDVSVLPPPQRLPHPVYHQLVHVLLRWICHLLGGWLHGGAAEEGSR